MIPYIQAFDEFFTPFEFDMLRAYAWRLQYGDYTAPFDEVTYKNIGLPVPQGALDRIEQAMSWILGYKVTSKYSAFRLSLEGSEPPQWAHSDAQVAKWAMFIYLNDGPGGTVLLEHRVTGMTLHPRNQAELEIWNTDYNKPEAWEIKAAVDCLPNRAVLIRSELIHAALPKGGFGKDVHDGRLILLSFFD